MEVFQAPLQETSFKGKKQTSPHSLNLRYHVETKKLIGKDSLAKIYIYRARRQFSSVNKKKVTMMVVLIVIINNQEVYTSPCIEPVI